MLLSFIFSPLLGCVICLNSLVHVADFAAIARTVGHLSKSAEVMKLVNNLMKAPEVAVTMQEFSKEMTKVPLHLTNKHKLDCFCFLSFRFIVDVEYTCAAILCFHNVSFILFLLKSLGKHGNRVTYHHFTKNLRELKGK